MKIETRVLVRSSSVKTEYIPQYKDSGFLGLFRSWRNMEDGYIAGDNDAYYAWCFAEGREKGRTKATAEAACENYHAEKKIKMDKVTKARMHEKTATTTSYKHP